MRSRRKARQAALQALYQCDMQNCWDSSLVNLYYDIYQTPQDSPDNPSLIKLEQDNLEFSKILVQGVLDNLNYIDKKISKASIHWVISRMAVVDRNILRLACFEMVFVSDIPLNVSINEAIELAKTFGSHESPVFINGVLDKIAKTLSGVPQVLLDMIANAKNG